MHAFLWKVLILFLIMKKKIEFVVPGKQLHCRVQHRRR